MGGGGGWGLIQGWGGVGADTREGRMVWVDGG